MGMVALLVDVPQNLQEIGGCVVGLSRELTWLLCDCFLSKYARRIKLSLMTFQDL